MKELEAKAIYWQEVVTRDQKGQRRSLNRDKKNYKVYYLKDMPHD
jgi:hypothetical protein